jgi:tRNA nucleotidyltransferase/poly(A) polymerase
MILLLYRLRPAVKQFRIPGAVKPWYPAHMWNAATLALPPAEGVYLVGGCVRDLLLGRRPSDIDVAVIGDAHAYARSVAAARGGRLVEIGKPRFRLYRVAAAGQLIDVSAAAGAHIRDDLRSRDFTINSLAVDIATGELIDIAAGREDLAAGVIRMVSADVFRGDPVRLIRAFRLAAQFGFSVEPLTLAAIAGDAAQIASVAGERVREELFKLLTSGASAAALMGMHATGLLAAVFPELAAISPGGAPHGLEVLRCLETLRGQWPSAPAGLGPLLDQALGPADGVLLKIAALLHNLTDAGPPARRLKFSARHAARLATLVQQRMQPRRLFDAPPTSPREAVRLFRRTGDLTPGLLLLAAADLMADTDAAGRSPGFPAFTEELLRRYFFTYLPALHAPRPISGEDLVREFGLKPSPLFRDILEALDVERLSQGGLERGAALRWVDNYLKARA